MGSPLRVLVARAFAAVCGVVALLLASCGPSSTGDRAADTHAPPRTNTQQQAFVVAAQAPADPVTVSCGLPPCPYPPGETLLGINLCEIFYAQNSACSVTQFQIDEQTIRYVIAQPIVTVPNWDYPMVKFMPGDVVALSASGCVQTGGDGGTWKNYIFPYPEYFDGDWKYDGTVTIPYATNVGTPIYSLVARNPDGTLGWLPHTISDRPATDSECVAPSRGLHLQLGYTDDDYRDNPRRQPSVA